MIIITGVPDYFMLLCCGYKVKADCANLFQAIDSLYSISQKPEYMQMASLINEIVDAQAQVIRSRITRAADKDDEAKSE
ncbi:hypothetical protein [Williamwhitmania taraxaci]|uniref:Uncharacterized protein n=1 Tax=Williamwhitmania taraxaci TaxID=1640674 RepID=A0A1G6RUA8_9BACT|nr:hypothetical protein [Williamwhitmania taraxaci]SDD08021.1 hypothetical protein SAMN05216323_10811 [Williamwhitmania taraxaci]